MLQEIFSIIVSAVAGVLSGFLLLRFWMQALRIRPPLQLAQPIFQITDWIVHPIRRVVPGVAGYDWASLIATFIVALTAVFLEVWLFQPVTMLALIVLAFLNVVQWTIYGLIAFLILEVVFSWVNPHAPLAPFVRSLNEPILTPLRKVLPPIGGIDFSCLVALLILQILLRVIPQAVHFVLLGIGVA